MASGAKVTDRDRGFAAIMRRFAKSDRPVSITVGFHDAEGGASTASGKTVLEVATINEYGLGVPARSMIAAWYDANEAKNQEILRKIGERVVKGKITAEQGLEQAGLLFVAEVQARISSGIPPENAQSTIDKKGSSTPLVDTGQMKSAIRHRVQR